MNSLQIGPLFRSFFALFFNGGDLIYAEMNKLGRTRQIIKQLSAANCQGVRILNLVPIATCHNDAKGDKGLSPFQIPDGIQS